MKNILVNRENDQIPEILEIYSKKLDELIDISSKNLSSYLNKNLIGDDKLVPCLFFRNAIEYADSISILIKNSSIEPIKSLNRILLENLFQIEYLLNDDTEKKSFSFLVWSIKQDIKAYKKLKNGTSENKIFKEKFEKEKLINDYTVIENISVEDALEKCAKLLKQNGYKEASIEYEKTLSKNKNPNWYSLYKGPKNIYGLAENLSKMIHYELFYRLGSNNVHSSDILKNKLIKKGDKNSAHFLQIRVPHEAPQVLKDTLNFLISINMIFLSKLVPEELDNFGKWYLNFQEFFLDLGQKKDFEIIR